MWLYVVFLCHKLALEQLSQTVRTVRTIKSGLKN